MSAQISAHDLLWNEDRQCFTVKETEHYFVDIVPMIFNFRLVLTPKADTSSYDTGWCYGGTDRESFARAYIAAMAFDPETEETPTGFIKQVGQRTMP